EELSSRLGNLLSPDRRRVKVIEALADVMVTRGVPQHLRSDNGPEAVARDLRKWLAGTGAKTAYKGDQAGGALARSLQHRPSILLAGLSTTRARGLGGKVLGVWRSGNHYALPTSPHPDCD